MIRVVIAEDQQMLRGAFASLLKFETDIEVLAEASDGKQAWEAIQKHQPDVCVLDIEMPLISGLELAELIRRANLPCKIMIVTTFARPGYLKKAIDAQVDGYLLKDEPIDFLIESIRKVMKGERVVSTDLAATLFMKEENPLSEREIEMLRLTKIGMTTDDISKALYLTKGTVRNYLSSAIQKLEAESRQQAVQIADEKGWL
ncbi:MULTISPECIES: response regulator transcription factor [Brevibacillus]|jgi:two-component system response regulator DesR|uniref:LuxR family two component transcriptional regulator n=1 Tax=Brevibacillus borstelensis AK1 TaxID=1300222 RepID=M8D8Q7_9BACL|nr:response regulator transcription factor [Brevibacillus borstelensis]EMT52629.1 LuxR family two component transcriptional regulator [Brevibacillus borstelensis AK1]MBE5396948.1 response regulator transcription factor [Brevibacillus borstelensis]MCC0563808.1 response regulator transcription factor [Brevibacillus borstelensis]MCM3472073.1 response regulator transcription factor [Brevibacillus borstelensis]MCM3560123.1 response regulator transcription factor [Brevibacillus borstelensis]